MPKLGPNLDAEVSHGILNIRINLKKPGTRSKSGKSMVLARTDGRFKWLGEIEWSDGSKMDGYGIMLYAVKTSKRPPAKPKTIRRLKPGETPTSELRNKRRKKKAA